MVEPKETTEEAHYNDKIAKLHEMISTKKKRTGKIDCAIVMDLTGSMSSYINKMKVELAKLITQLSETNTDIQLKFAFVGYKDFCDGKSLAPNEPYETMTQHFSIINFTDKMQEVNEFLQKQSASGGGDAPEDIVGGFNQALQLNWQADSHKIVVLVADAPTHGKQYHDCGDDFPDGHPNKQFTLEYMMEKFAKINATFLVFRLTDSTEQMFDIMKKEYKERQQKIRFVDLREILKQESYAGHISKKKKSKIKTSIDKKRRASIEMECKADSRDDMESCSSDSGSKCIYKEEEEEEKVEGKKLIRASSIMNMKITEKIMVESDEESYENEEWEKK